MALLIAHRYVTEWEGRQSHGFLLSLSAAKLRTATSIEIVLPVRGMKLTSIFHSNLSANSARCKLSGVLLCFKQKLDLEHERNRREREICGSLSIHMKEEQEHGEVSGTVRWHRP